MLTARQFEMIGRVTIAFNGIEAIIEFYGPMFVYGTISDGASLALGAKAKIEEKYNFKWKLKSLTSILNSLAENHSELSPMIDALLEMLKRAGNLSDERNQIVHGHVVVDPGSQHFVLKGKGSTINASEERLESLVAEVSGFVDVFGLACYELYTALSLQRGYSYS
jgi:hypothetical protein